MMFIKKILGFSGLLWCVLVLPGGILAAQGQEPTPSTPELEAQPNTNQYPAMRRRRGFPAPTQPTPNPDPPAQPDPPANPANPVNPVNNVQPNNFPANAINRTANSVPVSPAPGPQQTGLIGPPAPPPRTLEEMAPTPAKIVYQNGLLSVESVNARLIDILNGIRAKTGIQFEGIQTTNDRVAGKFGPAPADQVLTSLLQGSRFDYVIIGVPDQPSMVQRVLLTPSSGAGTVAGAPGSPVAQQNGDDDDDAEDASTENPAPEQAPQQAQQPVRPRGIGGAKTTEQLLEELKQLQQSQIQNQQNQANPVNQPQPQNPPAPQQPPIKPH